MSTAKGINADFHGRIQWFIYQTPQTGVFTLKSLNYFDNAHNIDQLQM